jgi:replicative DNA helicase
MHDIAHVTQPMERLRARMLNELDRDLIDARHTELMSNGTESSTVLAHLLQKGLGRRTLEFFKVGIAHKSERFRHTGFAVPYAVDTCGLGSAFGSIVGARLWNIQRRPQRASMVTGSTGRAFNHDAVVDADRVLVVDDEIDAMIAWQCGIREVTVWSQQHADALRTSLRKAKSVVLWLVDADIRRVLDVLGSQRCSVVNLSTLSAEQKEQAQSIADEDNAPRLGAASVAAVLGHSVPLFRDVVNSAHPVSRGGIVTLDHYQGKLLSLLDKTAEQINGKLTGLRAFDRLINGMRPELRVITGREGEGKSEFSDWLHAHMAMTHGDPVLIISPENGAEAVAQKHFKRMYGAPISECVTPHQKDAARRIIADIGVHPIFVMDVHGMVEFSAVVDCMERAVAEHGVRHILLDHWQWFVPRMRVKDDTEAVRGMMRELAPMPAKLGAGITMVSQPRHGVQLGAIPGPQDLFGGASIKQGCQTGMSIWRDKDGDFATNRARQVKVTTPTGAKADLIIAPNQAYLHVWKSRHDAGNTGGAVVNFDRSTATYMDPPSDDAEPSNLDAFSFG